MVDPAVYPLYQRLQQNPDDAEALFMVWQWHGDRGEFQQLAALVEQTAERRTDPNSAADLFFRAGELWAKNVGRADRAITSYRRAFELDPRQTPALIAARGIYLQVGNFKLAGQLFERQLATTGDPGERLPLLREFAAVRAQLGDPSGQAAALEEVLRATPEDFEVMRELAGAYVSRAASPEGSVQDSRRAAALLATIAQGLGGEHALSFSEAALDAWPGEETAFGIAREHYLASGRDGDLALRQIRFLDANPDSELAPEVRKELARSYVSAEQWDDAVAALAPLCPGDAEAEQELASVYRQSGRLADLVVLLSSLPPARDPGERMAALREIAEIAGQAGDRDATLGALRELLNLDPADPEALALVEDDLRARRQFDDLRRVLANAAHAPGSPTETRKSRLREVARLSERELEDGDAAAEAWREVLSMDARDPEASEAYERLLTGSQRWDELAHWLERCAAGADEIAEQRALWERLATLHRERRSDPTAEATALHALWSLDTQDDAATTRLIEALARVADVAGITAVLRTRAEGAEGAPAVGRWSELAEHLERHAERDEAMRAWRQVATLDPAQKHAWESIERLLERTGRHDLLLETLIAHAEGPAAGERPAPIHARAADVARQLGDLATGIAQASRAAELAPDDEPTATLLMDLYEGAGEYDKLVTLLRARVARAADGEPKIAVLRRAARILGRKDPEGAGELWQELRDVARRTSKPDDAEAVEALARLAESAGDGRALSDLLAAWAPLVDDRATRVALMSRRAELLAVDLHDVDAALETLRVLVTDVDPTYVPAWARIVDLAAQRDRFDLCADALERQLALLAEDEDKARVAARLADVAEQHLHDAARSLRALEAQYDADPTDYVLVDRMVRAYEHQGRWPDVVKYLELLAEVDEDPSQVTALLLRTADVAEHRLHAPRKAFEVLAPAVREGNPHALDALRGVAHRGGLEAELVPILAQLAQRASSPRDRAELWREAARLAESSGDRAGALEAWGKALLARPMDPGGLEPVERLARELQRPDAAAQAYSIALAAANDPPTVRETALRGVEFLQSVGAVDLALDLALAGQGRLPTDDALMDAVVSLAPAAARGDEMFVAFDRRRGATRDEGERYGVVLRAAECALTALGDRATAFQYLDVAATQALAGEHPDEHRLARIESLARGIDEREPQAEMRAGVVEQFARLAAERAEEFPNAAAVLLRRAAAVCADGLALPEQAVALATRAVTVWPGDEHAAVLLERVAGAHGRLADVAELYRQVIDDAYEADTARMYHARRAALLGDGLGRVDEAVEALRTLIEIAPKDLDALRLLQSTLRKHSRYQDLLMALQREIDLGASDAAGPLRECARIWDETLRNSFEAKDAWKRVLRVAPGDPEATAALERLERRRGSASDGEDSLTTGELLAAPSPAPEAIEPSTQEFPLVNPAVANEPEARTERPAPAREVSTDELAAEPLSTGEYALTEVAAEPAPIPLFRPPALPAPPMFRPPQSPHASPLIAPAPASRVDDALSDLEMLDAAEEDEEVLDALEAEPEPEPEEIEPEPIDLDADDDVPSLDSLANMVSHGASLRGPATDRPPPPPGPPGSRPPPVPPAFRKPLG